MIIHKFAVWRHIADKIFRIGALGVRISAAADHQHPFALTRAVHGKLKQIRTFPHASTDIFPIPETVR